MDSGHGIIGKWGKREVGGGGPRDNIDSVPSREEEEEEAAFLQHKLPPPPLKRGISEAVATS